MTQRANFVLRIPRRLHQSLKSRAQQCGKSLNTLCVDLLSQSCLPDHSLDLGRPSSPLLELADKAARFLGEEYLGCILFGSYARGEALNSSDVDILFVLKPEVNVNRKLYREWNTSYSDVDLIGGLPVSVQFAALPREPFGCSNLWLELAIDGIIVRDDACALQRFLVATRQHILAGQAIHRTSHGLRYWVWMKEAA